MHKSLLLPFTLDKLGYRIEPEDVIFTDSAEHRLMLSVLHNAIQEYRAYAMGTSRRAVRLFGEAKKYLWSNDEHWPFSVVNICEALHLDVGYLRRGLIARQGEPHKKIYKPKMQQGYSTHQIQDADEAKKKQSVYKKEWVKLKEAA